MQHIVKVSNHFRKKVSDTIQAIIVFIIVYILLIIFAVALTAAAGYAGFMIIVFKPMWITFLIGIGLILMGLLVLIFLVKFIFHKSKTDTSGLFKITETDAPELFSLINEVADEAGTKKPKNVYLSNEVNAYVFYDSSFWSMFFPVKKNLTLGLGLMNSLTVSEFKAILAHEFGHFSQRSMKVGSYTYNVNKVIYNMLYDNDSYNLLKQQIAGWSNYVVFFANLATDIVGVIQKILKSLYNDINLNYMALSREMEFHADEMAVSIVGPSPMIAALLRTNIADESYQTTLQYYSDKIKESVKTDQFFKRHRFVLEQLGKEGSHSFVNGFPMVQKEDLQRYNHSKLVITNQWASHPSISDRISAIEQLNLPSVSLNYDPAISLLPAVLEEKMSVRLFSEVPYEKEPLLDTMEDFTKELIDLRSRNEYPKLFAGYYDLKNPDLIETESVEAAKSSLEILYSKEVRDKIYVVMSLANDINILKQITEGNTDIKSFDYDGEKFSDKEAKSVMEKLETEQQNILDQLKENDKNIYAHFYWLEKANGNSGQLRKMYDSYKNLSNEYDEKYQRFSKLEEGLAFTKYTTPVDEIEQRFDILKKNAELDFKNSIKAMLANDSYADTITAEEKSELEKYISREWIYFIDKKYDNDALQFLFSIMNAYVNILSRAYFDQKKNLLNYFAELHELDNPS